jgi:PhnB protein
MNNRPACPPGLNWLTPFLTVQNGQKALDFYINVFGFTFNYSLKNDKGEIVFARVTYKTNNIILGPAHGPETPGQLTPPIISGKPSLLLYVYCDDLNDRYTRCVEHKVTILEPIHERWFGDLSFRVQDPDGYLWDFATNVKDFNQSQLPKGYK